MALMKLEWRILYFVFCGLGPQDFDEEIKFRY
jgi:hypothetical protein